MKYINMLTVIGAMLMPALFAAPMPAKADLLATNTVVATYLGTKERPCMFRTALCPDRCNHGAKVAMFRVTANENYAKPGKYGDDKAEPGSLLMIDVKNDTPGQSDEVKALIAGLTVGDKVRMTQDHYYGDFGQVVEPFRPVTKIEKLQQEKKDLVPALPEAPAGDYGVMPIMRRGR